MVKIGMQRNTAAESARRTPELLTGVDLSVLVPVHNEQDALPQLHRRLTMVMRSLGRSYEIIYIDDGSTDASLDEIRHFSASDQHTRYISFTRNFGQAAAITAGQAVSCGGGVICIDADLQNPPEEIPKLLAKFDEGYEIVYGVRRNRQDPALRRASSAALTWILRRCKAVAVDVDVTSFTVTHRRIVDAMIACPETHRCHPVLAAWLGARSARVEVEHAARSEGESKYGLGQLCKLAMNLLTSYTNFPLKIASIAGLVFSGLGFAMACWAIGRKLLVDDTLIGWPSMMAAIGLLGGVQLLAIGTIGEYVGRAYSQLLQRPLYVIREDRVRPRMVKSGQADLQDVFGSQMSGRYSQSSGIPTIPTEFAR